MNRRRNTSRASGVDVDASTAGVVGIENSVLVAVRIRCLEIIKKITC